MKRRTFLISGGIALIASIPLVNYLLIESDLNPITTPYDLSNLADKRTLRDIGITYRKIVPIENSKDMLSKFLFKNFEGEIDKAKNKTIEHFIKSEILNDFVNKRTIIINGWILGITEARQCALYSLK